MWLGKGSVVFLLYKQNSRKKKKKPENYLLFSSSFYSHSAELLSALCFWYYFSKLASLINGTPEKEGDFHLCSKFIQKMKNKACLFVELFFFRNVGITATTS